jgi:hypothetical protein
MIFNELTDGQKATAGIGLIIAGGLLFSIGFGFIWGTGAALAAGGVYTAVWGYNLIPG